MQHLQQQIQDLVNDLAVQVISVNWRKENQKAILQIVIDREEGGVDLELCALISQRCDQLIEESITEDDYFLEVCSLGTERKLTTIAEIRANIGKYVYVRLKDDDRKIKELRGYLGENGEDFVVDGLIKGRKTKLEFSFDDLEVINLTVKI